MKLTKFALTAALVLAGSVLQSAHAQTPVVYTDGDLFMGFRSTTSTNDYLWDIGQFSLFNNDPVGFHLALGNINLDLTTVFGSGWQTNNNVQWGAAGTHDFDASGNLIANLYATKVEPTIGTRALAWTRQSTSAQIGSSSQIETLAFGGFFGNLSTANNPTAIIQSTTGVSWASFQPGGTNTTGGSFSTWVPTIEGPTTPGVGTGIPGTRLDLFEILPDNSGTNPASKYIGTFSIDAAGNVSYDVFAAVPEPSTYASLIAGAGLLLVMLRFRSRGSLNA
ncbi:MAG: PEP-CTERM sorting domain-containing protein [Chthoniobacterales bacterium]|nr:PEP-CTERM sorting domain-containing protein [Chthoniobacterales bacterium]